MKLIHNVNPSSVPLMPQEQLGHLLELPDGIEPGEVTLTIRAYDSQGNLNQALVRVYLPSGDEQPCDAGDTCPAGLECSAGLCVPGDGIGGLGAICTGNEQCETELSHTYLRVS